MSTNPFAAPQTPPYAPPPSPAPFKPVDRLEYMRAYNYVFENPNWMNNVLLLALIVLAAIIPGVGIILQLVFFGYQFEIIDSLLRSQGRVYPDFDFNRFGEYLVRGLWPFLINMIVSFVMVPVIYVLLLVGVFGTAALAGAAGNDLGPIVAVVVGGLFLLLFVVGVLAFALFMTPMILRAGLAQDFASAFKFDWILDFVKKTWLEMVLAGLFMILTTLLLEIVGLLACIVGLFFVVPLILFAYAHLLYQLYLLFLSRGGAPVLAKSRAGVPTGQLPPSG